MRQGIFRRHADDEDLENRDKIPVLGGDCLIPDNIMTCIQRIGDDTSNYNATNVGILSKPSFLDKRQAQLEIWGVGKDGLKNKYFDLPKYLCVEINRLKYPDLFDNIRGLYIRSFRSNDLSLPGVDIVYKMIPSILDARKYQKQQSYHRMFLVFMPADTQIHDTQRIIKQQEITQQFTNNNNNNNEPSQHSQNENENTTVKKNKKKTEISDKNTQKKIEKKYFFFCVCFLLFIKTCALSTKTKQNNSV